MELLLDGCLRIAQMEDNLTALSFYFPTTLISKDLNNPLQPGCYAAPLSLVIVVEEEINHQI
jgi:hypothetical protein